jgi:type IV pilus assembly protein PilA
VSAGIGTSAKGAEDGFTLVELLVVMLVIGLLAAIAIPAFFNQTSKAKDASAKSQVRELAEAVEQCRVEAPSYSQCDEASELKGVENLSFGTSEGQVGVMVDSNGYTAYAISKAKTNNLNHVYGWQKSGGTVTRICLDLALQPLNGGGCSNSGW